MENQEGVVVMKRNKISYKLDGLALWVFYFAHRDVSRDCNWTCDLAVHLSKPIYALSNLMYKEEKDVK